MKGNKAISSIFVRHKVKDMSVKIFWVVFFFLGLGIAGCEEDDVDSIYTITAEEVLAVVSAPGKTDEDKADLLADSLEKYGYIGQMELSGESRAENNKLALEKYKSKFETLQNLDLDYILDLQPGETVRVSFRYVLYRGKEKLADENVVLEQTLPVR